MGLDIRELIEQRTNFLLRSEVSFVALQVLFGGLVDLLAVGEAGLFLAPQVIDEVGLVSEREQDCRYQSCFAFLTF